MLTLVTFPRPRPRQPYATIILTALLLHATPSHSSTQPEQLFMICKETNSLQCFAWTIIKEDILDAWSELPPSSVFRSYCSISALKPTEEYQESVNELRIIEASTSLPCMQIEIQEDFNWDYAEQILTAVKRKRRQTGYSPRGRYRGQTQSQYLSIDRGSEKDEGKAEAHSSADTSRASVSGKSGMGQAQSQTIYDPSCDECYKPETAPESLQQKPRAPVQVEGNAGHEPGKVGRPGTGGYPFPSSLSGTSPGTGINLGRIPSGTGNIPLSGQGEGSGVYGPGIRPSGTGSSQFPSSLNGIYIPGQGIGPSVTAGSHYPSGQNLGSGSYAPVPGGSPAGPGGGQYPSGQRGVNSGFGPRDGNVPSGSSQYPNTQSGQPPSYDPSQNGRSSGTGGSQYPTGGIYGTGPSGVPSGPGTIQYPSGGNGVYSPGNGSGGSNGNIPYSSSSIGTGIKYPSSQTIGTGGYSPRQDIRPSGTGFDQYPNTGGSGSYGPGQGSIPTGTGISQYPTGTSWTHGGYSPNQGGGPGGAGSIGHPSSQGPSRGYVPSQSSNLEGSQPSGGSGGYILGPGGATGDKYPSGQIDGGPGIGAGLDSKGHRPIQNIPAYGSSQDIRPTGNEGYGPIQDVRPIQGGGPIQAGRPIQGSAPIPNEAVLTSGPSSIKGYGLPDRISGPGRYGPTQISSSGSGSLMPIQGGTSGNLGPIPPGSTYYCCIVGPNGRPQYISGVTNGNYGLPLNIGSNFNTQPDIYGQNPTQVYGTDGQIPMQNFNTPFSTVHNGLQGPNGGYSYDKSGGIIQSNPSHGTNGGVGYGQYPSGSPITVNGQQMSVASGGDDNPYGTQETHNGSQSPITHENGIQTGLYTSSGNNPNSFSQRQSLPYEVGGAVNTPYASQPNVLQQKLPASSSQFGAETLRSGSSQPDAGSFIGSNSFQAPGKNGHLQSDNSQLPDQGTLGKPQYAGYSLGQRGPYEQGTSGGPSAGMQFSNFNGQGVPGFQTDGRFGNTGQPQTSNNGIGAQGPYGQTGYGYYIPSVTGQSVDYNGVPQEVYDPNVIITKDADDSEALATVSQNVNGTTASASSKGGNEKGRAQTQVQGTYTGSGSFSAQAQISDDTKGAESQVSGGKQGASSNALGRGRNNTSQADVQLGSESGSLQTHAQSDGSMHSSNSQVQGSLKGGMADAQARGPGSTSSQAQIGFTPYNEKDKSHDLLETPFVGEGTASAQSSGRTGQSQSQLQGAFKYGIKYNGAAQSGASLDKDAVFTNRLPFVKIDVFDETSKVLTVDENVSELNTNTETTTSGAIETEKPLNVTPLPDIPFDTSVVSEKTDEEGMTNSESRYSGHSHSDHHISDSKPFIPSEEPPTGGRRSFQNGYGSNVADYEYTTDKDENPPDDYDPEAGLGADGTEVAEVEQTEYGNYDEYSRDTEPTHQSLSQSRRKDLVIRQSTDGNTQRIVLDSLSDQDALITQRKSEVRPDESRIYQPGERVPGTGGYTIPIGFTGSVKSVASKDSTYAVGSKYSSSQAQTVSLKPGSGKIKYSFPKSTYGNSIHSKDLRSLSSPKAESDRYVSVSKSVTGALDGENNIRKQYSHTYYTKSSSCGYFTFTCTIVSGTNGKKKVCKPKIPTNPDGSPMRC